VIAPQLELWYLKAIIGDYPYYTMDGTQEFLKTLSVDKGDTEKIAHGNAETLLQGLRKDFKISQERPENCRARPANHGSSWMPTNSK
jgi:hypothetical protein